YSSRRGRKAVRHQPPAHRPDLPGGTEDLSRLSGLPNHIWFHDAVSLRAHGGNQDFPAQALATPPFTSNCTREPIESVEDLPAETPLPLPLLSAIQSLKEIAMLFIRLARRYRPTLVATLALGLALMLAPTTAMARDLFMISVGITNAKGQPHLNAT